MISSRVVSQKELEAALDANGFEPTEETIQTGRFWRHRDTGKHLIVPNSVDGFYPDWLLDDLYQQIGRISIPFFPQHD